MVLRLSAESTGDVQIFPASATTGRGEVGESDSSESEDSFLRDVLTCCSSPIVLLFCSKIVIQAIFNPGQTMPRRYHMHTS